MANGKKTFYIEINGIQESVNAVESLNKQLDNLEARIEKLASKSIKVNVDANLNKVNASQDNSGEIKQEVQAQRELNESTKETIRLRAEEFNNIKTGKDSMREFLKIAKELAAQKAIDLGQNDLSTMEGMKQQLKDIKTVMQTLNVESDKFKDYQQQANELNTKLKDIEAGYGQYGRNVGNYANSIAEGLSKIQIKVGETTREFDNAREASRTLNMELKNMALNGQQGTKEYNDLNEAVKQMNSTLKDVEVSSVAMDNLLDTMQGIVAVASTAKGLGSLFGLDEGAIEQTIQKLVALQNVLQGIEVIRKQMQTQEGIGLLLSKGNKAVDALVTSIFGLGTASKSATLAVKALSTALKGIGIGLVVAAVSTLITKISDWISKQEEAKKKAEELRQEENKLNASLQVQRVQLQNTLSTLESFNGSKKEEERIVKDLNSKYGQALGTYKTIAQWKDALKEKTDAYIESLKLEAEMQALLKQLEDAYIKQREAQNYDVGFWEGLFEGAGAVRTRVKAQADQVVKELEGAVADMAKKIEENNKKHQINLYSPQSTNETKKKIKDDSKKIEDAVRQAENNINDLKLKVMREGLRKELAQLDENNRREIEKIRKNGQKVEEQLLLQEKYYQEQRKKILQEYSKETLGIADENTTRDIQTQIDKINNSLDELGRKMNVTFNEPRSSLDDLTRKLKEAGMTIDDYFFVDKAEPMRSTSFNEGKFDEYMQQLAKDDKIQKYLIEKWGDGVVAYSTDVIEEAYDKIYSKVIELRREYGGLVEVFDFDENENPQKIRATLQTSLEVRTEITRGVYRQMLKQEQDFYRERERLQKEALDREQKALIDSTEKEISETQSMLETLTQSVDISSMTSGAITSESSLGEIDAYFSKIRDENRDTYTDMEKEAISYVNRLNALYDQLESISRQYSERRKKIETETLKDIAASENKLFDQRVRDYDEYIQKMQKDMSNLPTTNKWGFTDLKGLKSAIGEITDATSLMRQYVQNDIDLVNDDFRNGLITEEDKNRILANLSGVFGVIDEITKEADEKLKEGKKRRKQEINEIIQILGQAAVQVIQSIGEINQAAFEKQLEEIEKQTEALEKQLDKQKELTEKYKDDVDSIEDELATARGARRQHLIDQLNAQMEAQRESLAQEKKIEKEKEKLEKKKEKLEYDNKVRQWKQNMLTAAMNAALAISAAAVNAYPIPAIPMIAAATAIGAAQIAAVAANKPRKFADGGLLNGRSHSQGGIPVGNTGIEVEGKEYIINKHTTMQNVDALNFINSKRRKLTLDDFIDFYSKNSNVSRNVTSMRAKFADGGELPTLRTDISLNSRLVDTMEKYSERPTVVQVVDIINKTDEVKRVQALAGLE